MKAEEVIKQVSEETGVSVAKIYGRRRTKEVFSARLQVYMKLRADGRSYPEIGKALGRDHTTIIKTLQNASNKKSS